MKRKTLTIDVENGLREHLENQATKQGFSKVGTFVKHILKKVTKFKERGN